MPDLATYLAFIAATLAYQLTPGPDMMLVMGRGIGHGRRAALATAIGCVAAGFVQIPLLALGVASLVAAAPLLFEIVRYAGAAYLLYLGFRLVFARQATDAVYRNGRQPSAAAAFAQGMIANLTNPKTLVFMLAFLPQFIDGGRGSVAFQFLVFGATMKATGLVTLGTVALGSGTLGGWLARRPAFVAWQERFAGMVMIGLGVRLLLSGDVRAAPVHSR